MIFYPFGNVTNDLALARQDDAFTTIPLSFDLPFFGELFRAIHVSTNGIIFFGQGSTAYVPSPFPLNGTKCVAAYWVDSDPREGGDVFYREVFDPDLLTSISNEVRSRFVTYSSFRSSWAFIVTFNNVPRFGCRGSSVHPCQKVVNHQTILTSNGIDSFVIFLYDKLGYEFAQIGFNAGDGKRYFLVPNSNTANISTYALEESNVGEAGKWMFSITSEISSVCSSSGFLEVYPKKVFYFGGQEILITGPCFQTNQTSINVEFGNIDVNCSVVDNLKVQCVSPYIDNIGMIQLIIRYDDKIYTSFIITHDENDEIVEFSKFQVNRGNIDEAFTLDWNATTSENNILLSGVQEDIEVDANGNVVGFSRQQISIKVPNIGTFDYQPSQFGTSTRLKRSIFPLIRKILLFVGKAYFRRVVLDIAVQLSCDVWYNLQPNQQEMERIKDRESRRNPCQPSVPPNFPVSLPGNFEKDDACHPSKKFLFFFSLCSFFHPGSKGCYRSTNNPDNIATQCCYNSDNQLLIGPPGGGTLDMYDSNKSKFQHFMKDVLPYLLCCKLTSKCDKYYEKRPSVDSRYFVPPVVRRANGDPHFITMDNMSYDFNPVGEFIYLQAPELSVQVRMSQYIDNNGIPKQASYFSAFAIKSSTSQVIQVELTALKTLKVKAGNDILYSGVWSLGNISVEFSNSTNIYVESSLGLKLQVQALNGILHAIVMLEQRLKGQVYGLIGNWDDNPENDLMLPNKTFISRNSSNQDIHYQFGMQWATNEITSLFSYPDGLSWRDYQNTNFLPFFGTPPSDSRCNGDMSCLFDLHVTGNISVALSNIEVKKQASDTESMYKEISETCLLNVNISNGKVQLIYDTNNLTNVIYQISCSSGYRLSGSERVTCVKGNLSESFGTCNKFTPVTVSSSANIIRSGFGIAFLFGLNKLVIQAQ